MAIDLLWIVIRILGSLLATLFIFRAYLKFIKLAPCSSLFMMVKTCTNWALEPLEKIFPYSEKYDWGSVAGSVLTSFLVAVFFYFSQINQKINSQWFDGFAEMIQSIGFVFILGLVWLFDWFLHLLVVLVIVHVVLSWVGPATKIGDMKPIISRLVSPLLLPLQKLIFKRGSKFNELNIDPSPIIIFIFLQVLFLVNDRITIEVISAIF